MLIIPERPADIGNFIVGRILPFRKKRMVGPFIFIDHFGPAEIGPNQYMDVDQHPHIGIATLTYLYEGATDHEDSIGTKQRIEAGAINLMFAGSGVTHTERTPEDFKDGKTFKSHGFQIWIALPKAFEDMNPEFHHLKKEDIPKWEIDTLKFKLFAGEAFGRKSPLKTLSALSFLEISSASKTTLNTEKHIKGELGIYVESGSISINNDVINAKSMAVFEDAQNIEIEIEAQSRLLFFAGEAFPEERHIYWNFVSSDKEKINQAINNWKTKRFPMIPGDTTYIPIRT